MTRYQRKQRRFLNTYKKQIEACTLTHKQYNKLSFEERTKYLARAIKKKYPNGRINPNTGKLKAIGEYFDCIYCAEADLFEDGYISEI